MGKLALASFYSSTRTRGLARTTFHCERKIVHTNVPSSRITSALPTTTLNREGKLALANFLITQAQLHF